MLILVSIDNVALNKVTLMDGADSGRGSKVVDGCTTSSQGISVLRSVHPKQAKKALSV